MDERTILKFRNANGSVIAEKKELFSFGLHTHTYYEMIFYEPFDGELTVNGTKIDSSRGAAVLISPLDFHETEVFTQSDAAYVKVGFDPSVIESFEAECSYALTELENAELLRMLFDEILLCEKDVPLMHRLIAAAAYYIKSRGRSICRNTRGGAENRIAVKAAKILNENFNKEISLTAVADRLAVSPQYLSKSFAKSFGEGFSTYLARLRLKFAADLIKTTNDSLTAISLEAGFGNFSHFSRAFKRTFGKSPREHRKENDKKKNDE